MSVGSIASAPYTKKNGVWPVDLFGVVRMLQSTDGNSSTHAPAARCKGVSRRGRIPCKIEQFIRSTCPFDCGWATEAKSSRMPPFLQYLASSPTVKFVPLSVIMLCGTPNRMTMSMTKFLAVAPSSFLTGLASTHLVYLSTATRRCVNPPLAVLNGPIISSPQTTKDHVMG